MNGALDLASKIVGLLAALLGLAGYVLVIGATILWLRLADASLPKEAPIALAGRDELIATGAQAVAIWLILAIMFGGLAVWIAFGDPERRRFGRSEAVFAIAVTASAALALDSPASPLLALLPTCIALATGLQCWRRRPSAEAAIAAMLPAAVGLAVAYAAWKVGRNGFADAAGESLIFAALMVVAPALQRTRARWEANRSAIAQIQLGASPGKQDNRAERQLLEALRQPHGAGAGPPGIVWIRRVTIALLALLALGGIAVASQVDKEANFHRAVLLLASGECVSGTYIVRGPDQIVLAEVWTEDEEEAETRNRIATFPAKEVLEVQIGAKPSDGYPLAAGCGRNHVLTAPLSNDGGSGEVPTGGDNGEGVPPRPPPQDTRMPKSRIDSEHIPIIDWKTPGKIITHACRGASLTFTISVAGSASLHGHLEEVPGSANQGGQPEYVGHYPRVYPRHGSAHIVLAGRCPNDSPVDIHFDVYVDPSGKVVDTDGTPIAGATVTLLRSLSPEGPFIPVPARNREMSARNRDNPDTTAADGSFGWDVSNGYYVVRARKPGCTSASDLADPAASSPVFAVPPHGPELLLVLRCMPRPGTANLAGGRRVP